MLTRNNGLQVCVREPIGWIVSALQDRATVQNYIAEFAGLIVQVRRLAGLLSIVPATPQLLNHVIYC